MIDNASIKTESYCNQTC